MHSWLVIAAARTDVILWGGIIAVLAVIGGSAIMIFRRSVLAKDSDAGSGGFTLEDLRKLRDRGELTAQEYEVARNQITQAVKKSLSAPAKTKKNDNKSRLSSF